MSTTTTDDHSKVNRKELMKIEEAKSLRLTPPPPQTTLYLSLITFHHEQKGWDVKTIYW